MPFAFNQIEPSRIGQIQKWDIPLNDWLGLKFSEGMSYGIGRAVWDFGEDLAYDEGKPEDPKILNKSFGIEGYLQFDKPITIGQAALLRERKLEELERMSYLEGASHSWKSTKAAAGFIAGLAGGFAHPADLGTSFIPFVGSSAKAAGLARIGGKGLVFDVLHSGRQAIARGLVAEEAIGAGKAAAFTASMMDGVLSQAAVEIPIALQKHRNQADYTLEDSAFNILFGGVFAGGLHLAGRGVGKLFEMRMKAAADVHERLDPDTKEAIFREHQDAFVEGRRPDTERIVALDEAVIRERVAFDEAAARAEAEAIIRREQGVANDASANELLQVAQAEASRGTVAGGILGRLVDRFMGGERTVEVLEQIAALTDRVYRPSRIGPQESLVIENVFGARNKAMQAARDAVKKARTELYQIEQVLPDVLKRLEGAKGNEARQLRTNASNLQAKRAELIEAIEKSTGRTEDFRPLSGDELAGHQMAIDSRPSLVEKAKAERARRVSEYVDKKRKDWEATMEGRLSAERRAEITRQQEQGKLLPDDELAKYQAKPKVDAADVEMVMADVATLEKEIKDMMDSMPESAEKESIKAEIDALMAKREVVDQIKKALPTLTEKQALEIASMSPAEANVRLHDAIKRRDDLTKEGRPVADDERLNAEDYASGVLWKAQQAGLEAKTASERARRVSEYVDKKRKDWEATMEGRLSAERIVALDEAAIRERVAFDEAAARAEAMRSPEFKEEISASVDKVIADVRAAFDAGDPVAAVRAVQEIPEIESVIASGVDLSARTSAIRGLIEQLPDVGRADVGGRTLKQWVQSVESGKVSAPSKAWQMTDDQLRKVLTSKRPQQFKDNARQILAARELAAEFPYEGKVQAERARRVSEYVDKKRKKREDLSPSEKESFKPLSDERISAIIETSGTKSGEPELNFRKFIDSLSDTSEPLKRLLQWVADRIDVPVMVHTYEPTRFQGRYVESGTGRAWIDIHTKLKNGKNVSEKMLSRIVAHEAIHRLVTSKLNSSPHGERMGYLFSVAKSAAKASGFEHRGFESISEFISEAMSSKKMRDFLAKTEVPVSFKTDAFEDKIKNLWNGFISAVRSAIGIDGKTVKTSVLEEVVGLSDEIAASQRVATSTFIYVDQSPMVKAAAPCAAKFNG